jgi:glycosyltransferase involved in cell wall biosynthesis
MEIILVDLGSPDGSGAICDEYASRDSRFVVIHQKNSGVSVARNTGLDHATGDYIGFVDPDDWIEPSMYETMMTSVLKEGCDGAVCSTYENSVNGMRVREQFKHHVCHQPELTKLIVEERIRASLVRTLIKRSVWDNVRFTPATRTSEDFEVFPRLFYHCHSLVFLPDLLYHWVMRPSSLTHITVPLKSHLYNFYLFKDRYHFCQEHFPLSIPYMSRRVTARALNVLRYFVEEGKENDPEAQKLITFLKENQTRFAPHLHFVEKFHLNSFFSCRPVFRLYTKLIFWNRSRIAKRRNKKSQP